MFRSKPRKTRAIPCFIAAVEQKRKILADGNAAVLGRRGCSGERGNVGELIMTYGEN